MAKRKRLGPVGPQIRPAEPPAPSAPFLRAPIADVATDAAMASALEEVSRELQEARSEGRMVIEVPLSEIRMDYLVRDRAGLDDAEMETLVASIRARGQQMPVEVVPLEEGGYGLISGWRRCQALARLARERGVGPVMVRALIRQPADAEDAYLSMVEENEIRSGLSYFERARIAAKAVEQGIFDSPKSALLSLFRSASRSKRSKIRSFLSVVAALDGVLRFPQALGERLGLRLAKRLEADPAFAESLRQTLAKASPQTAEEELKLLSRLLGQAAKKDTLNGGSETESPARPQLDDGRELRPGLMARVNPETGRLEIWGEALTLELRSRFLVWLERSQ